MDLKGDFRWAQAPLNGCFKEGNADGSGRLIVPITLEGPVTKPSWTFATDTIARMVGRTARCEAVKAIKQNLPDNLGEGAGQVIKGLLRRVEVEVRWNTKLWQRS